jgi:hypothetical protein
VVFEHDQFSPISDHRYYEVTISDDAKKAVRMVTEKGVDYSMGAVMFHADYLKKWKRYDELFSYGGHVFYKLRADAKE